MKILYVLVLISVASAANLQQVSDVSKIKNVLLQQQIAWNEGNIDEFMLGYWQNDSLKFIGKKGITYGWLHTLNNYKKSYPDKATMGELIFEILSVDVFSGNTAFLIGKWHLKRNKEKGDLGGHFTLLFKKIKNKWVIVCDHTS